MHGLDLFIIYLRVYCSYHRLIAITVLIVSLSILHLEHKTILSIFLPQFKPALIFASHIKTIKFNVFQKGL